MSFLSDIKKEKYGSKYSKQIEIVVYVVKGNKQLVTHYMKASRRFVFDGHTYIVKRKAIFAKIIDGYLKPCIVYTEGNPNPHTFNGDNLGLTEKELNDIYGEDLYEILVKIQAENKIFYMMIFNFLTLVMSIVLTIAVIFGVIL